MFHIQAQYLLKIATADAFPLKGHQLGPLLHLELISKEL